MIETPVFNASCVHPDQTPRSYLGLHCLLMSLFRGRDAKHNWVNSNLSVSLEINLNFEHGSRFTPMHAR